MNNAVFLEPKQYERLSKDLQKTLIITVGILMDKFKIGGAVARALLRDLCTKKIIVPVGEQHNKFMLYSGKDAKPAGAKEPKDPKAAAAAEKGEDEPAQKGKGGQKAAPKGKDAKKEANK